MTGLHTKNFVECIRSRHRPVADVQLGYQASTAGHLANIAYRTGHKLHWDSTKGEITNNQEASKLLTRKARKPWNLIE